MYQHDKVTGMILVVKGELPAQSKASRRRSVPSRESIVTAQAIRRIVMGILDFCALISLDNVTMYKT